MSTPHKLTADGWRECPPDQFHKYARCFHKQFDTPTRCGCDDDGKPGIQILLAVYQYEGNEFIEAEIRGKLPDGTWVKIMQYGLPKDLEGCLALIPRMLATWEAITNYKPL